MMIAAAPMRVSGRRGAFPVLMMVSGAGCGCAGQVVGIRGVMIIVVASLGATRSGALLGFYGLILHVCGEEQRGKEGDAYKLESFRNGLYSEFTVSNT